MKSKLKGGIESIIATVIIAGIVVALICVTVIPIANQGEELTGTATEALVGLGNTIKPNNGN